MNNPAIEQTLIELEESLSKLESARSQVNRVSEKSEELISSFSKVLKGIQSISNGIGIDKAAIKENLDKSFETFGAELKEISKESNARIKLIDDTLKSNQQSFGKEIEKNIKNIDFESQKISSNFQLKSDEQIAMINASCYNLIKELQEISKQSDSVVKLNIDTLNTNQKVFNGELEKNVKNIESEAQKILSKLQIQSDEQIALWKLSSENLTNEVNKVNSDLINFKNHMHEFESQLMKIDFMKEFKSISQKINSSKTQTLVVNFIFFFIIVLTIIAAKWIR